MFYLDILSLLYIMLFILLAVSENVIKLIGGYVINHNLIENYKSK